MRKHKKRKTFREYLGFNDTLMWVIGIPLVSVLSPMVFFNQFPSDGEPYWAAVTVNLFFCLLFWHLDRIVLVTYRRRYPDLKDNRKRIILSSGTILIGTVVIFLLIKPFVPAGVEMLFGECEPPEQGSGTGAALTITLIVITVYESLFFQYKWKDSSLNFERLKKKNAQAQLESLKSQINPHFLFNSLNTLSSIIPKDPDLSVKFVEELSAVYRCILELGNKDMVTLDEELSCLDSYAFLLQIRFGDNIRFVSQIDEGNRNMFIVPLSIQMLYENAIKHNVASKSKPLTIEMFTDEDHLVVRNNLQPKITPERSTKTGLDNVNKRYKMLMDQEIVVEKTETHFSVCLPLAKIYEDASLNY